ncbi:MAG: LysR substrate-binding domain-containing protein, partial [Microcoleaceae cyanobacterium]
REYVSVNELLETAWVMREAGSGAQQMFEQALQSWGVDLTQLNIVLVLNSSEMVKAVVEGGLGAAAIPELMAFKEIQLKTLKGIKVKQNQTDQNKKLEIIQPIWQLKHSQRFPTKILTAFEEILLINEIYQVNENSLAIAHN